LSRLRVWLAEFGGNVFSAKVLSIGRQASIPTTIGPRILLANNVKALKVAIEVER